MVSEAIIEKLPYQRIKDSPTIKYYTDWKPFEEKRKLRYEETVDLLPSWVHAPRSYSAVLLGSEAMVNGHGEALLTILHPGTYPEKLWVKPMDLLDIDSRMIAVHAHRWRAGIGVMIPPATIAVQPIRLLSVGGGKGYAGHHIVVFMGRGSKARVEIHDAAPPDAEGLKTIVVEALLEQSSHLELITVSKAAANSLTYHRKTLKLGAGSRVEARSIVVGGDFTHYREDYMLDGVKSSLKAEYRLASSGKCRLDTISNAVHRGAATKSLVMAKGAVMDRGYLVHRGLVRVLKEAEDANTVRNWIVLLLCRKAKAVAVPMLEIEPGKVSSARHAASVASLEEDQLFYLTSRGLSREEAMTLLLKDLLETEEEGPSIPWTCG